MYACHLASPQRNREREFDTAAGQALQTITENPAARYALEATKFWISPTVCEAVGTLEQPAQGHATRGDAFVDDRVVGPDHHVAFLSHTPKKLCVVASLQPKALVEESIHSFERIAPDENVVGGSFVDRLRA